MANKHTGNTPTTVTVAVIGAGITGLTCAWHLRKRGVNVVLLEKEDRIGGLIKTVEEDGFVFESGPNTGVVKYPEVAELFDDLQECQLETARESSKRRLIWKGDRFHELPSGLWSAIATPLFTFADKLRILGEPWRSKGTNPNESVGALAERRLGKSFVDYAVDPFLSGVYAGDPYKLPTRVALPRLYQLEQNYGSFIRGSIALAKIPKTERDRRATKKVFSAQGGFSHLVEALGRAIGTDHIVTGCHNMNIQPQSDGSWTITYKNAPLSALSSPLTTLHAQHVITTCPAYALPELLPFVDKETMSRLSNLYYAPVVQIGVGIKDTGNIRWEAFGGLVPSREKRDMLGILMPSACFTGRAPEQGAAFAYFIGGTRHPEYLDKSDHELKTIVNQSLSEMLNFPQGKQADVVKIFRHRRAIPQYMPNTDDRLEAVKSIERRFPTLHISGNLKDGIGMGDRIKQATDLAAQLFANV